MSSVHTGADGDQRADDDVQTDRAPIITQLLARLEARERVDDLPLPLPFAHALVLGFHVAVLSLDHAARRRRDRRSIRSTRHLSMPSDMVVPPPRPCAGRRRRVGTAVGVIGRIRCVRGFTSFHVRLPDEEAQQPPQEEKRTRGRNSYCCDLTHCRSLSVASVPADKDVVADDPVVRNQCNKCESVG